MKKRVLVLLALLALLAAASVPAFADQEQTVSCTVTPKLVSLMVDTPSFNYGAVAEASSKVSSEITVTNNGTVTETFMIKGTNTTGGNTWTLVTTPGEIALDKYMHEFAKPSYPAGGSHTSWTALSTDYQMLATGVAGGTGTQNFKLQIWTPSTTSDFVLKTTVVWLQATG